MGYTVTMAQIGNGRGGSEGTMGLNDAGRTRKKNHPHYY